MVAEITQNRIDYSIEVEEAEVFFSSPGLILKDTAVDTGKVISEIRLTWDEAKKLLAVLQEKLK